MWASHLEARYRIDTTELEAYLDAQSDYIAHLEEQTKRSWLDRPSSQRLIGAGGAMIAIAIGAWSLGQIAAATERAANPE